MKNINQIKLAIAMLTLVSIAVIGLFNFSFNGGNNDTTCPNINFNKNTGYTTKNRTHNIKNPFSSIQSKDFHANFNRSYNLKTAEYSFTSTSDYRNANPATAYKKANTNITLGATKSFNMRTGNGNFSSSSNIQSSRLYAQVSEPFSSSPDLNAPMSRAIPGKPGNPGKLPISSPLCLLILLIPYILFKLKFKTK